MDAFSQFYRDNKDRLYGYLLRMTAEPQLTLDLVQESFTRYLKRYGSREFSKPRGPWQDSECRLQRCPTRFARPCRTVTPNRRCSSCAIKWPLRPIWGRPGRCHASIPRRSVKVAMPDRALLERVAALPAVALVVLVRAVAAEALAQAVVVDRGAVVVLAADH